MNYVRSDGVIETDLDDEMVLLNPFTQEIFTLNSTGRFIWLNLQNKSVEEIAVSVHMNFIISESVAKDDVIELVSSLQAAGLISVAL